MWCYRVLYTTCFQFLDIFSGSASDKSSAMRFLWVNKIYFYRTVYTLVWNIFDIVYTECRILPLYILIKYSFLSLVNLCNASMASTNVSALSTLYAELNKFCQNDEYERGLKSANKRKIYKILLLFNSLIQLVYSRKFL